MKYRITFCGRLVGAIGRFESFDVTVEADNAMLAELGLYETHEHISAAVIEPVAS